jgi:PAS domain S-box-containing protein
LTFANVIAELAKGAGLLLILSYAVSVADDMLQHRPRGAVVVKGLIFGIAAVVGMTIPLQFSPGVIIDARSVVIGVGSAFGGPVVAAISGAIAAAYRFYLGGDGAWVGIGVVASSAAIGLEYWWLRQRWTDASSLPAYFVLGLVLHIVTLAWFSAIPNTDYMQILRAIGFEMLVVFTPATVVMCVLMADIAMRIGQRNTIEAREADYELIIENMIDVFYRADADGRLTMVSPSVKGLLGYDNAELVGTELRNLYFKPEEREKTLAHIARVGGRVADYVVALRAKDGREVWVSASTRYRFDTDGTFAGVEGTVRDITEHRRAEEEQRLLAERLSLATAAANIGVWDRDMVRDEIIWDHRMYQLYGVPNDGGRRPVDLWESQLHPEDSLRAKQAIADAIARRNGFH